MSIDPRAEFDHTVLDMIEHSPVGAVPVTPSYQDALKRLYLARQVYVDADHPGGHVTARSLAQLPLFHAHNLQAFIAGRIIADVLESNASIYDRYVQSLVAGLRGRAEEARTLVIGKSNHHRAKHGAEVVHDPLHTIFLVPGAGPNPGLPGNYLHGSIFHVGPAEEEGSWVVQVHDGGDGEALASVVELPEALARLQEVLESAPFHLEELETLGFRLT